VASWTRALRRYNWRRQVLTARLASLPVEAGLHNESFMSSSNAMISAAPVDGSYVTAWL